jgi:hypothetical protein
MRHAVSAHIIEVQEPDLHDRSGSSRNCASISLLRGNNREYSAAGAEQRGDALH